MSAGFPPEILRVIIPEISPGIHPGIFLGIYPRISLGISLEILVRIPRIILNLSNDPPWKHLAEEVYVLDKK